MGYFDGMEKQIELEVGFKKLISVFISFAESITDEDISEFEKKRSTQIPPAMPTAVRNCKP